jgi:hypothetical protein
MRISTTANPFFKLAIFEGEGGVFVKAINTAACRCE